MSMFRAVVTDAPTGGQRVARPAAGVERIRQRLPYAWQVISMLVAELTAAGPTITCAEHATVPPSESQRTQLHEVFTSDTIRVNLEHHFAVRLAWVNHHFAVIRTQPFTTPSEPAELARSQPASRPVALPDAPQTPWGAAAGTGQVSSDGVLLPLP
jgi:hypothetical protein